LHDSEVDLHEEILTLSRRFTLARSPIARGRGKVFASAVQFAVTLSPIAWGRARLFLVALVIAALPAYAADQPKLRVVTTSADLKALTEAVGGARVEVESLTAPEQDPHAIELKPRQLSRAQSAALVVRVGLDHEPWFTKLRLPRSVQVLDASRTVRLTQTETPRLRSQRTAHVHAFGNTHYWLDPQNALSITAAIRDALGALSPADTGWFEANTRAFTEALAMKMKMWESALAPLRGHKVVVIHDSWSYFAERFGLRIVAAAEPHPGTPPSPAELSALFERMRETQVRLVIADPHSNPALVQQIAARTGAQPVTLAPSGHDYFRLFDENVARLVAASKKAP
jgi:ABC-type Zn uptake system ZnuABC Zn-binding protein ZnuA